LLFAGHQLVTAVVLLLAPHLLESLLVHPPKEEVLIRVEIRAAHEQMPECLDVLDPDRYEVVGFDTIILALNDDVLDKVEESFECLAVGVAACKDKLIHILGHLVLIMESLELVLHRVVVVLDVADHDINQTERLLKQWDQSKIMGLWLIIIAPRLAVLALLLRLIDIK
jgi:hypothetical protein